MKNDFAIQFTLLGLVVFDLLLVVWAFGFPDLWFALFHTASEGSPGAELFLKRCGANWAAFALFQGLALRYWKSHNYWLAIVAGLRFADIFTDPTYVIFAEDPSWLAWLALPVAGVINIGLGLYFATAYLERRHGE